jgi:predicted acetyltransferase
VPAALASRPYPLAVSLDCHLDVLDETQSWNHGHFHLQIRDGKGHVDPGGDGTVRVTANGLSALYAGYASPWDLRALGMIDGPDEVLAGLALAFSGPVPWMPDVF